MNTYRVGLHSYKPLIFSVERLNKHGCRMRMMTYRSTLKAAIGDAEFFGGKGKAVVTKAALEADDDRPPGGITMLIALVGLAVLYGAAFKFAWPI